MKFERTLDPTARIPGHVYVCKFHYGYNEVHDPDNGGHYPPLPADTKCKHCVEWEDLCDSWITVGSPDWAIASVRCLHRKHGSGVMHMVDDLNGQRFSWTDDRPETYHVSLSRPVDTWAGSSAFATATIPGGGITLNPGDSVSITWHVDVT